MIPDSPYIFPNKAQIAFFDQPFPLKKLYISLALEFAFSQKVDAINVNPKTTNNSLFIWSLKKLLFLGFVT